MRTDPVTLEVLKSYFVAVAEGMGHTLERTSHTTFIKETADFVTALATPDGEFFAYPQTIGVSSFLGLNMRTALAAAGCGAPPGRCPLRRARCSLARGRRRRSSG